MHFLQKFQFFSQSSGYLRYECFFTSRAIFVYLTVQFVDFVVSGLTFSRVFGPGFAPVCWRRLLGTILTNVEALGL